jgi:hypothetical protein
MFSVSLQRTGALGSGATPSPFGPLNAGQSAKPWVRSARKARRVGRRGIFIRRYCASFSD